MDTSGIITIKLDSAIKEKCRAFANKRTDDSLSLYQFRGEARRQKIFADIFYGVLAEHAVGSLLLDNPDLNLYEVEKKSFSSDLKYKNLNVHVKSQGQESANAYGISFVFQRQDPLLVSPKAEDVIAMCVVLDNLDVKVLGFLEAKKAQFDELKISRYRGTKKAIYFSLIRENIINLEGVNELSESIKKETTGNREINSEASASKQGS